MAKGVGAPLFIVGLDSVNKRIVLDRLWDPAGEIDDENAAIKDYIYSTYVGVNPEKM